MDAWYKSTVSVVLQYYSSSTTKRNDRQSRPPRRTVVEEAHTDDGSACEVLKKAKIEYRTVANPETGASEQKLERGHFHHLWNVAHDITELGQLDRQKLHSKIRDLEVRGARVS